MKRTAWHALSVLSACMFLGCGSDNDHIPDVPDVPADPPVGAVAPTPLVANLTGDQENPAVTTTAAATGTFSYFSNTRTISGSITLTSLTDATAAHLHSGFAGVNGPVIVGLTEKSGNSDMWEVPTGTVLSADDAAALLEGGVYVNVHTATYPGGIIRGQVTPIWVTNYGVPLAGSNEVPPVTTTATGTAYITGQNKSNTLTVNVTTSGVVDPTAAHVHTGAAGTNGAVLFALTRDGDNWSGSATLTLDEYLDFGEGSLYVNVHTTANPGGELRGQIEPP